MVRYRELWKVYQDVFDLFTIRSLDKLANSRYLRDIITPVSQGKEAWVFKGIDFNKENVAVKIYKIMVKDYKKIWSYLILDPRFEGVRKTRVEVVLAWVRKEFRNLNKMYQANVRVPMPIAFYRNVLVMEFIGNEEAAPLLKDRLPEDPEKFMKLVVKNYERMVKKAELVHGDISEFNILNFREKPVIIDVSQAVPLNSSIAKEFLERDIENLKRVSKKLGFEFDFDSFKKELEEYLEV